MHTLILLATTDPAIPTQPGLRPGLTEDQITPGLLGFAVTFGIVVIMFFLIRDMVKRIRRIRYRAQVEEGRVSGSHGPAADHMGIPIRADDAGTSVPAHSPVSGVVAEKPDETDAGAVPGAGSTGTAGNPENTDTK
ncbi:MULTISPECIES: hypothetical protein [Arthrobacter]|uniref:hypothetical protein n=1 Tax=unclassified Arthrobacter TaxID=235627 RepID=UPI0024BBBC15|nr:hypothetical protein [Arthrobacter sp. H35-MC1]MDJ0317222.1 hypothetical protein [Arthrobacter sp. H35-MC1]